MTNNPMIEVALAGGGDERVPAKSLSYIRRITETEAESEPEGASTVVLGRIRLISRSSASDLASQFGQHIPIIGLSMRDGSLAHVSGASVNDVDDAPSTLPGAVSWLVFGVGVRAPRLAVRQNREQLCSAWAEAGLDPKNAGI